MSARVRRAIVQTLVLVFLIQTWFVYTDPVGRRAGPLSQEALRGQEIWRAHNCQVCHQIYGFGGFLGPDLTNAAEQLGEARLESILTVGSKRMPAFGLEPRERAAILAFLTEVDRTGVSQPRLRGASSVDELLARFMGGEALSPAEQAGLSHAQQADCLGCHLPNRKSLYKARDLSTALAEVGAARVHEVLENGLPGKGMPRLSLSVSEREELLAFLGALARRGDAVRAGFAAEAERRPGSTPLPPWFEYGNE